MKKNILNMALVGSVIILNFASISSAAVSQAKSCNQDDPYSLKIETATSADAVNVRIKLCYNNDQCHKIGKTERYIVDGTNQNTDFAKNLSKVLHHLLKNDCHGNSSLSTAATIVELLEGRGLKSKNHNSQEPVSQHPAMTGSGTGGDSPTRFLQKNNAE